MSPPSKQKQEREAQRRKNRDEFPKTASVIDSLNKAFGPLKVIEFDKEAARHFEKQSFSR